VAEPIYLRVRRVLSASAEEAVDALERASGASLLREAIRQVEGAFDEVRAEHETQAARAVQAKAQQQALRERIAELDEKARFALGRGRDDLAEAAVSSQLDLEARIGRLDSVQADAAGQIVRLDECLAALAARKAEMQKQLRQFEAARRDEQVDSRESRRDQRIERTVARAEQTFERVMASTEDAVGADGEHGDQLAEIDALRRDAALAERMAALRAAARQGGGTRRARR
jgi:phage shock protein A